MSRAPAGLSIALPRQGLDHHRSRALRSGVPAGAYASADPWAQAAGAALTVGEPGSFALQAQKGRACHGTRRNDLGLLLPI